MPNESTANKIAEIERFDPTLATDVCGNKDVLMKQRHDGLFVRYGDVLAMLAKPEPDGWAAVSERKPEPGEWVLAFNGHWRGVAKWHRDDDYGEDCPHEWIDETDHFVTPEPTHWLKLPTPPVLPEGEKA